MNGNNPSKILIFFIILIIFSGCAGTARITHETGPDHAIKPVPAERFDTGRMWTFDFPPIEYFNQTYDFNPDEEWFTHARLATLRLPNCTAAFVSGDGLIMTNHHCALGAIERITEEGESLLDTGFYASSLEDERAVENLYVDQLVMIEDVTEEVLSAFDEGTTDAERVSLRQQKIAEIEERFSEETGLTCNVVTFFNGGRYALYGYKRYNNIKFVFAPESAIGFFGGDPDNFTYPRYNLDMTFMRVYDDEGNPYKPEYYFRWSDGGAGEGEAVFVIGNPGRTGRLNTVDQLIFNRDEAYPYLLNLLDNMVWIYSDHIKKYPEKRSLYETRLFSLENSQKAYRGILRGLNDPELMGRKVYFEKEFQNQVRGSEDLSGDYGHLWGEIAELQKEKKKIFGEMQALTVRGIGRTAIFGLAMDIVNYAKRIKAEEEAGSDDGEEGESEVESESVPAIETIYPADGLDAELEKRILKHQLRVLSETLGKDDPAVRQLIGERTPEERASELINESVLLDREATALLLEQGAEEVLKSDDPFIRFVQSVEGRAGALRSNYTVLQSKESALVQRLGRALYDIYGTSIPPDATFTLRIADGVVKSYEYNGTIAPPVTTFYGLYDRYHSHGRIHPWTLPEQWKTPPGEFNMSTPVNFVSTNDIIGGNSGSPVININREIVGLVFDGNIESLPGNFIFAEEYNRAVSVHSEGIIEALRYMYSADRIVYELETGIKR